MEDEDEDADADEQQIKTEMELLSGAVARRWPEAGKGGRARGSGSRGADKRSIHSSPTFAMKQ